MSGIENATSNMDRGVIVDLARQLRTAELARSPIAPLTDRADGLTLADAYAIQRVNLDARISGGGVLVGRKIGLTSKAMQDQLGVDQPDVGFITEDMLVADGGVLERERFIAPRVEAEIAFRLAADLPGPVTIEAVREAIGSVMLAVEVIDSRIVDWKIKLVDTVADNASSAAVVFGPEAVATPQLLASLPGMQIELEADSRVIASGLGEAVLGDPLRAVVWLAETLVAVGDTLRAGDLILAGAVHASVPLYAGSRYSVREASLPTVAFAAI